MAIVTLGIDLAKNVFALHGVDATGKPALIRPSVPRGKLLEIVGSLRFNLAYNTGVAFSMGSDQGIGPLITVLALAVVVGLSLGATSRTTLGAIASGLIAGGALGNLLDRAFRGDADLDSARRHHRHPHRAWTGGKGHPRWPHQVRIAGRHSGDSVAAAIRHRD